jgi:hypothetical protein
LATGKAGELIVSPLHGQYFEQTYAGNVFIGATLPAGTAIPVNTTTAPTFALWNPADSGRLCVPIFYKVGFVSGTGIAGAVGYGILPGAGGSGLNSVVTAFTQIQPFNAYLGTVPTQSNSRMKFGTTVTIVTTGAYFIPNGISQGAPITSTALVYNTVDWFDGIMIIPPGVMLYTCASAAIAEVSQQVLIWEEVPVT